MLLSTIIHITHFFLSFVYITLLVLLHLLVFIHFIFSTLESIFPIQDPLPFLQKTKKLKKKMVDVKGKKQDCWVCWILDIPIDIALRRED